MVNEGYGAAVVVKLHGDTKHNSGSEFENWEYLFSTHASSTQINAEYSY